MIAEAPVEFEVVDLVQATEKTPTLADIERLEGKLLMSGLNTELPVNHTFLPHVYMREVFMPKGFIVIGHEHVDACDNVMLCGRIRLVVDGKVKELTAPCVMRSEAHTRKIAYVLEDCIWATLHKTDETDVEKLEDALIVKSNAFLDYESQKQIEQLRAELCEPAQLEDSQCRG